jgi:putative chitinase
VNRAKMDLKELLKRLKLSEQTVSMVLGALVIVVVGVLIFNYFRGVGKKQVSEKPVQPGEVKLVPEGLPTTYKVEKGDHLWQISQKFFGSGYNWVDIARENHLKNPNKLLVGQELAIPKAEVRKPVVAQAKFGEPISGSSYTVSRGDHLWGIAVRAYGDGYKWVEIARANNLVNPNIIHPGNILTLPR